MKKAIIIPVYLKFNKPEELAKSVAQALARRAVESLKILNDQDSILLCFDFSEGEGDGTLLEMDRFFRDKVCRQSKEGMEVGRDILSSGRLGKA